MARLGKDIRQGLQGLGNADAATSMGALEAHGKYIMGAADNIASAIRDLAEAIREVGSGKPFGGEK